MCKDVPLSDKIPSISRRNFLAGTGMTALGIPTTAKLAYPDTPYTSERTTIIGHRGCAGLEPPNTAVSIQRALEFDIAGVELDVQQTKDGTLVLFHDPVLDLSTGGIGPVNWNTYTEIKDLEIDGEQILTLAEGLSLLQGTNAEIYLELKSTGFAYQTIQEVRNAGVLDRTTIVSFDEQALQTAKDVSPETPRGMLGSVPTPLLLHNGNQTESEFVFSHYVPTSIPWFIEKAHDHDKKAGIWTLKDFEHNIKDALSYGPDVLVTNHPDIALKHKL